MVDDRFGHANASQTPSGLRAFAVPAAGVTDPEETNRSALRWYDLQQGRRDRLVEEVRADAGED